MISVGKLFAVAAILALVVGFVRWPQTGFYTITIKNRAYGLGSEYWAFAIAAIFALLAAAYYWLPILISLDLVHSVSLLHFCLSAISAFAFLLLLPVWNAFTRSSDIMFLKTWGCRHSCDNGCLNSTIPARTGNFCRCLCMERVLRKEGLAASCRQSR